MEKEKVLQYIDGHVTAKWNGCSRVPFTKKEWEACYLKAFTLSEKKANEAAVSKFLKGIQKNKIDFETFLDEENFLCIREYMGIPLFQDYLKSMCSFLRATREYDKNITASQIWQALRNYLIFGMIVAMTGEKQTFHDAIMGFSLLYPYTDNYIDDTTISGKDKDAFNRMIYDTLRGADPSVTDALQRKTKQCVEMCRNYRGGSCKEEASKLCLLMLDAQAKSTAFMGMTEKDYETKKAEILDMLAYKGGMSVLIDYFFSVPEMDEKGIIFYRQFGLLLQMADDIQDIGDDLKSETPTFFSEVGSVAERDANLYQLMHFTREIFEAYDSGEYPVRRFMLRNCLILYMSAVLRSEAFFSEELKAGLEPYLPFRTEFASRLEKDFRVTEDMTAAEQETFFRMIDRLCDSVK